MQLHDYAERITITIADSDPEKGEVTTIVQGIGRATKELRRLGIYRNQEKKAHEKWHCEK